MPKTIYINGRFATKSIIGVTRYAKEVVEAMDRLSAARSLPRLQLICPTTPTMEMNLTHTDIIITGGATGYIWEQTILPLKAPGTLLSLCNTGPIFKKNQIVCIHGMNTAIAPSAFSLKFRLGYGAVRNAVAKTARTVTTVSLFSRSQIDSWGVRSSDKIEIAPCGCNHAARWDARASGLNASDVIKPYVFALGSGAHKNFSLLMTIAPKLKEYDIDILIAGAKFDNLPEEFVNKNSNVRMLGFVSEADLAFLYSNAKAFAFPSFTEGFGIPPLEAMHFGCPVVASNRGSIPEILGDKSAILLDPDNQLAWIEALVGVVKNGADSDRREEGYALTKRYTWEKTANYYLELADQA